MGFHTQPGISTSQLRLQLSIWVLIVSWCDQYVDCAVEAALSRPDMRYVIRPIYVASLSKTRQFRSKLPFFHRHSTNISQITNRNARGERAVRIAQFTDWSHHDTMRTQKLNWSQSGKHSNMEPQSGSNLSPNPVDTPVFRVKTRTAQSGPVPNPHRCRVTLNRC